ncbi:MAG: DNA polymerase III subunit delta [Candidatus Marinimicrobia bacterium]|nr:DNA polymerase III subunit delta [Candidatus Neomarinimicrobiota bacterium]
MSWFSDYFQEIKKMDNGNLQPVYFLFGDDFYLQNNFIDQVTKSYRKKVGEIDREIVYSKSIDISELQNMLYSISMFQKPQLIIIKDIKKLKNNSKKLVLKYLNDPVKDKILVLVSPEIDNKNSFLKSVKKKATTLMITSPFENEIPFWIKNYLAESDSEITDSAIDELIKIVGTNLSDLINELDKLTIYLEKDSKITDNDVRFIAGYSKTHKINDLLNAIGKRDKSQAIFVMENLISNGFSDVYMLITLYNYIWGLAVLKNPQIRTDFNTGIIVKIFNTNQLNQMKQYSRNYSKSELLRGINAIVEGDVRVKTTQTNTMNNLILVIEKIMESK